MPPTQSSSKTSCVVNPKVLLAKLKILLVLASPNPPKISVPIILPSLTYTLIVEFSSSVFSQKSKLSYSFTNVKGSVGSTVGSFKRSYFSVKVVIGVPIFSFKNSHAKLKFIVPINKMNDVKITKILFINKILPNFLKK